MKIAGLVSKRGLFFCVVFVVSWLGWLGLSKQRFRAIVVHHSASSTGSYASINRAHRARGWLATAYHLVLANGRGEQAAGMLESGFRYRWMFYSPATRSARCNLGALHLCVIGNYEQETVPSQVSHGLGHALKLLQQRYDIPDDGVKLHRDCSSTACPGRGIDRSSLAKWRAADEAGLAEGIARQQRDLIEGGAFGWWQALILSIATTGGLQLMELISQWLRSSRSRRDQLED